MLQRARHPGSSICLAASAALLLAACDLSESAGGAPAGPSSSSSGPLVTSETWRYTVAGQSLVLIPDAVEDERYCAETHLANGEVRYELRHDTSRTATVSWAIIGDTLRFPIDRDTSRSYGGAAPTVLAITEHWQANVRQSGGPGLAGVWRTVGDGERDVFGHLGGGDDSYREYHRKAFALAEQTYSFADGRLTRTVRNPAARWFLARWNGHLVDPMAWTGTADSARYAIDAELLDERRVRLTGRNTGEVVIISWSETEQVFASSMASHPTHTYYRDPSSCPNASKPAWWESFLSAHLRSDVMVEW